MSNRRRPRHERPDWWRTAEGHRDKVLTAHTQIFEEAVSKGHLDKLAECWGCGEEAPDSPQALLDAGWHCVSFDGHLPWHYGVECAECWEHLDSLPIGPGKRGCGEGFNRITCRHDAGRPRALRPVS